MSGVVRRLKLDSDMLAEVGYSRDTMEMEVVFKGSPDVVFTYRDVEPEKFLDLINAPSAGSFFAKSIKARPVRYPFQKSQLDSGE